MNAIKFSHNWNNKLYLDLFTTIRKNNGTKWDYYYNAIGKEFIVLLKSMKVNTAILILAEKMLFKELPKGLLCSDTGKEVKEAIELFNKFGINDEDEIIVLTFKTMKNKI